MNVDIEIPVHANVECADGPCGTSTHVILNPRTRRVTHVVVREGEFPHADHLVPIALVAESTPHFIRLRATRKEVAAMAPFSEVEFLGPEAGYSGFPAGTALFWPYGAYDYPPDPGPLTVEHELIPPGEVAVSRGTRVEARDGLVGQVDDLVVAPETERITHLVLRTGPLWGTRDVAIPVEAIERVDDYAVRLRLDKEAVGALPSVPARQR